MRHAAFAIALGFACSACSSGSATSPLHLPGAEQFVSPAGGGPRTAQAGGGPAAPGATDGAATGGAPAPRTVEEADVWQKVGSTLVLANAWRGLVTVDVADPAAPALLARLPLDGTPVDLYLRGGVAIACPASSRAGTGPDTDADTKACGHSGPDSDTDTNSDTGGTDTADVPGDDTAGDTAGGDKDDGCGCAAQDGSGAGVVGLLVAGAALLRRRRA